MKHLILAHSDTHFSKLVCTGRYNQRWETTCFFLKPKLWPYFIEISILWKKITIKWVSFVDIFKLDHIIYCFDIRNAISFVDTGRCTIQHFKPKNKQGVQTRVLVTRISCLQELTWLVDIALIHMFTLVKFIRDNNVLLT